MLPTPPHIQLLTVGCSQAIDSSEYEALCKGLRNPTPPPITDDLSRWMSEGQWAALDVLTTMPAFASLAKDMEKNSEDWWVGRGGGCMERGRGGIWLQYKCLLQHP
jgi:dynein heavy chain